MVTIVRIKEVEENVVLRKADFEKMIYYRETNEEGAGLIKIYEYKIDENVKRFKEKF